MPPQGYPFDPDIRDQVARTMYELLPLLYRLRDAPPGNPAAVDLLLGDLGQFMSILAAPLAEVRQNIEELHADLFIDTCADWVVPYLADMIGNTLVFPDAASNRRDVRGTVGWRRRKGNPYVLQEMAAELTGQVVATEEGWKRLMLSQDLNLLRRERILPVITPATIAETSSGALDSTYHLVDPRVTTGTSGRYHPLDMTHWVHPTQLFPLQEGTAYVRSDSGPVDLRYAFHPLGAEQQLRVRRIRPTDPVRTDRVPPLQFAQDPGSFFDQEGRFTVHICGLAAAVPAPSTEARTPSTQPADPALAKSSATIRFLDYTTSRLNGSVEVALVSFTLPPLAPPPSTTALPNAATARVRGVKLLTSGGPADSGAAIDSSSQPGQLSLVRLRPVTGQAAFFPGAIVEIAGTRPEALVSSTNGGLAVEGFLSGALIVNVPPTWIQGTRWFYLAADGSLYDAQSHSAAWSGAGQIDVPYNYSPASGFTFATLTIGTVSVAGPNNVVSGPGASFPSTPPTATEDRLSRVPSSQWRGPVFMHSGFALHADPVNPGDLIPIPASTPMSLTFAARQVVSGVPIYYPFMRIDWSGPDPVRAPDARWVGLGLQHPPLEITNANSIAGRFEFMAKLRDTASQQMELIVRLEGPAAGITLPPSEVVYTSDDGRSVLVYLPTLTTLDPAALNSPLPGTWYTGYAAASPGVSIAVDGSTRWDGSTASARYSLGPIAPISDLNLAEPDKIHYPTLQRRRVRQRSLCQWDYEPIQGKTHAPTPDGYLDVDPHAGLFSLSKNQPPTTFLRGPRGSNVPASVTVGYQDGYSDHIGAHPAPREAALGFRQPIPTRLVLGSGSLHFNAPYTWHQTIPQYRTLSDALAAIAAHPKQDEIIQFEDSASYIESPVWPTNTVAITLPDGTAGTTQWPKTLTIQAAELQRPVLRLVQPALVPANSWFGTNVVVYDLLTIRGIYMGGEPGSPALQLGLPTSKQVQMQFCTISRAQDTVTFTSSSDGADVTLLRCITGGIALAGTGTIHATDSVIDATKSLAQIDMGLGIADAISASGGTLDLARVTIFGNVTCLVLSASEVIFMGQVVAFDRFHGCVRFSRVPPPSGSPLVPPFLPRKHRLVGEEAKPPVVRFVSRDRYDPAHARLTDDCDLSILRGAEDGSEMGAFNGGVSQFSGVRLSQRREGLVRRFNEYTPAGLTSGIVRQD